jgi:hypothetical protein
VAEEFITKLGHFIFILHHGINLTAEAQNVYAENYITSLR